MARLNIDDIWVDDPRREILVSKVGQFTADGVAFRFWRLAQAHYRENKPINAALFLQMPFAREFIDSGLAEVRGEIIYVKGSGDRFAWIERRKEAGKKGGKRTSAKKAEKSQANSKQTEANGKQNSSKSEQTQASPSSSPSSSLSTSDISFPNGNDSAGGPPEPSKVLTDGQKTNRAIAKYCELWRDKHGQGVKSPDIVGKDAGILRRLAKDISPTRLETLLDAFFQMPDSWLMKIKHPLEQFELKLKEVAAFADSGAFITRKQAQQFDNMATNMSLLNEVRAGRL